MRARRVDPTYGDLPRPDRRRGSRGRTLGARRGQTLLEVQVSFVLLMIGMAGICRVVVMQLRQVRQLELRLEAQVVNTRLGQTMLSGQPYYLVPWQNPWAQKLAGSGQILGWATNPCDPGTLPVPSSAPPANPVTVVELDASPGSESLTAYVDVSAP